MPRFVILAHDWPTPHFDLLFEVGDVLKAWRLLGEPGPEPVRAEPNFDHRLLYLEYEGPLSGERGEVTKWDTGTFGGELGPDGWTVNLIGARFCCPANLTRTDAGWLFRVG